MVDKDLIRDYVLSMVSVVGIKPPPDWLDSDDSIRKTFLGYGGNETTW